MMAKDVELTQADAFREAMVDAARARGGAGAEFIAKGHTNLWLDIAYDAAAALCTPASPTGDVGALVKELIRRADYEFGEIEPSKRVLVYRRAADAITALHARVQELEAKWVELPGVD